MKEGHLTRRDLLRAAGLSAAAIAVGSGISLRMGRAYSIRPYAARSKSSTDGGTGFQRVRGHSQPPRIESWATRTEEATVPDTLDLAQRAELALHALTGALDPDYGYELYLMVQFCRNPAVMFHEATGYPTNNPKFAEGQAMMRAMSGSDLNLGIQYKMMEAMLRNQHDDGLYYSPLERRPWSHESGLAIGGDGPKPFANVYGNSRLLLALMAWYQWDKDVEWENRARQIADALVRIAIDKGDYAYYPVGRGVGEMFSYTPDGWSETEEPLDYGGFGVPMYYCGAVRALSGWFEMSGDRKALETARKLANFLRKPFVWTPTVETPGIYGPQHGHSQGPFPLGHFHAHAAALRALLAYAVVAEDPDLMLFARDGYEWLRNFGVSRIGWFPEMLAQDQRCETCCIADMVALAIRLSDCGIGDYWDDVDRYVRNQLVEQQLTRQDYLEQLSANGPRHPVNPPRETADRVIERNMGAFVIDGRLTLLGPNTSIVHCCTGNGTPALYYAWESITRLQGDTAVVNLLLNRASSWLDVESYLPYQGKVVLRNETAKRILVRVPAWVDRAKLDCWIGPRRVSPAWAGKTLVFEGLRGGENLELSFPMQERREKCTLDGQEYAVEFKANTVIDISPRQSGVGYPIYERGHYRQDRAPLRRTRRYVPKDILKWA